MECTPSARLQQKFPDQSSEYSREGTLAHDLGELLLKLALGWVSKKKAKDDIAIIKDHELYQPEMYEYMVGYREFILEQWSEAQAESRDAQIFLEEPVTYDNYAEEGFATPDNVIVSPKKLRVNDLKYGKGVRVSAIGNPQIRIYGLGVHNKFRNKFDYDQVQLSIYQPRVSRGTTTETISTYELTKWGVTVVRPLAKLAWRGKGDFSPGEHCKFCRARHKCRALADHNKDLLRYEFGLGELLDESEIPEILRIGAQLVDWYKAVEKYAQEQAIKHGRQWPGWKLVHGRSDRKFTDEKAVIERLLREGYTKGELTKSKIIGIGDMEKLIGVQGMETLLNGLIIKPKGAATLVLATDPRERYNSAKEDFTEFFEK